MKKIRVVHIIPTLHLGGAERIMVDLIRFADRERYEFTVVSIIDGGPLEAEIADMGVHYIGLKKSDDLGIGLLIELTRVLNRISPDIVHTHLFGGHLWGVVASLLNRVPIVIASEQNTDVDLGELRHQIKKVLSFSADAVVAASEAIKTFLIEEEGISAEKISVIRNAVDVQRFASIEPPLFEGPLKLLSIGRLEPQKGHDVLFDALAHVSVPWELTLVGEGSLMEELANRAVLLRIHDRVHFAGALTDVTPLYAECDAVVMPSRWEGIGLVIMEGMAAGRPVIASRIGGMPEVITDKETGLLVEPEHSDALREALLWVHDHPTQARVMGERARAYAVAQCDVREMAQKYQNLYARFTHK